MKRQLRHLARRWQAWRYRRFIIRQMLGGAADMAAGVTVPVLWHYLHG